MHAHTAHPMRHFRNVFRVVGVKEKRLAEKVAAAKAHVKEIDASRASMSTQDTAAARQPPRHDPAPTVDERRLRAEVNAENARVRQARDRRLMGNSLTSL